jgi:hypothetical protein
VRRVTALVSGYTPHILRGSPMINTFALVLADGHHSSGGGGGGLLLLVLILWLLFR